MAVTEIDAGDYKDIDEYVEQVTDAGYDIDYENVVDDNAGFVAKVYINDELHATWEGTPHGHMVRDVIRTVDDFKVTA